MYGCRVAQRNVRIAMPALLARLPEYLLVREPGGKEGLPVQAKRSTQPHVCKKKNATYSTDAFLFFRGKSLFLVRKSILRKKIAHFLFAYF